MTRVQHNQVLLFAKPKPGLDEVISFLDRFGCQVTMFQGQRMDPFPAEAYELTPDLTISYISPWIIPDRILSQTRTAAVNFHPGSPEYPGIGCTNFALYDGADEFGVTAHLMERTVDSGRILGVRRFPIGSQDTVYSLTQKAYAELLELFRDLMETILTTERIPNCDEVWQRQPFTRRQLEELCRLDFDMSPEEIHRRVRATTYPGMPGPFFEWLGRTFEYNPNRVKRSGQFSPQMKGNSLEVSTVSALQGRHG